MQDALIPKSEHDLLGVQCGSALGEVSARTELGNPNAACDFGAKGFDTERRFVHILKHHHNGLVQFEFSVGTPDFLVELMLPQNAFDEFCARQKAVFVHDEIKQPWEREHDD